MINDQKYKIMKVDIDFYIEDHFELIRKSSIKYFIMIDNFQLS